MSGEVKTLKRGSDLASHLGMRSGFTLVELLVSVVLTVLVCVLVAEMSTKMLGSVSTASGRLTAAQKLDQLRHLVGDDLTRLPRLADAEKRLEARWDERKWTVNLTLPSRPEVLRREGRAWQRLIYHWDREKALLSRVWLDAEGEASQPEVILTGVISLHPQWLAGSAVDEDGEVDWTSASLPAVLRLNVRLTDVWEEGRAEELRAEANRSRDFELLLPVGGGSSL